MTDEQITNMLKEIIEFVDYDIYKDFFEEDEFSGGSEEDVKQLINIVRKYCPN